MPFVIVMAVCTILVMIAATEVDSGHPLPFSLTSFIQSIDSTPTFLPCCSHPFFHTYQAHFYHSTSTHPTNPYPRFSPHLPSLIPLITSFFSHHTHYSSLFFSPLIDLSHTTYLPIHLPTSPSKPSHTH